MSSLTGPNGSTLYADFDLAKAASPYEILSFLVDLENTRIAKGKANIFVRVLPGAEVSSVDGEDASVRLEAVIGCFGLLETLEGYSVGAPAQGACSVSSGDDTVADEGGDLSETSTVEASAVGDATGSMPDDPDLPCKLRASNTARGYIERWVKHVSGGRRCATITLDPALASAGTAPPWLETALNILNSKNFCIISTPSSDIQPMRGFEIMGGLPTCPGVTYSADLRAALYENADINLFCGEHAAHIYRGFSEISALFVTDNPGTTASALRTEISSATAVDDVVSAIGSIAAAVEIATVGRGMTSESQVRASLEEAYDLAVWIFQSQPNRTGKAIEIFKQILKRDPDNGDAAAMLAMAAHKFKRHEESIDLFKHALMCNDTDPAYYFNLALSYFALEDYQSALACLEQAAALDGELYEAHDIAAEIYLRQRNFQAAFDSYKRSCSIRGISLTRIHEVSSCLFELGRVEEAVENVRGYLDWHLYRKANDEAAAAMIWPWCARFYKSDEAKFPEFER